MGFIIEAVLCMLRLIRNIDDGINSFISGFLAGLTLKINSNKDFRILMAVYMFARSLQILISELKHRGKINLPNNSEVLAFFPCSMFLFFIFICAYDTLTER